MHLQYNAHLLATMNHWRMMQWFRQAPEVTREVADACADAYFSDLSTRPEPW